MKKLNYKNQIKFKERVNNKDTKLSQEIYEIDQNRYLLIVTFK